MNKRTFYTDDKGMNDFEDGYVFLAHFKEDSQFKHPFQVEPKDVVEERSDYVIIDTGSDAEFI